MQTDTMPLQSARNSIRPAVIIDRPALSSNSIFLEHFLSGLTSESLISAVVCPADCDMTVIPSPSVEVIIHPAFKLPLLGRQNTNRLYENLEKFKPTVLHCVGQAGAALTKKLAHKLNLPYVLMINSLAKRFLRFAISSAHCASIIAPAQSIADHLGKICPNLAERIEQVNIGTFVEDTCTCFCAVSRVPGIVIAKPLNDVAEFEPVLNAMKHLAIDGCEFQLAIIGTGPAEAQVRKLLRNLGLSHLVSIVAGIKPARSIFAGADIFIQPRPTNSFNSLLLEAMGVGMAVAGCKGGVDDLIIEGKTAVVFDHEDELSIYATVQQLLNQRQVARQIALSAQVYLRENHTVSKMVSTLLQIYYNAQQWMKR